VRPDRGPVQERHAELDPARLRDAGRPELADVIMDGTVVRAHHKAAAAKDPMRLGGGSAW